MTISGGGFGSVVDLTAGADISTQGDTTRSMDRRRRRCGAVADVGAACSTRKRMRVIHDHLRQRQGASDQGRLSRRIGLRRGLAELESRTHTVCARHGCRAPLAGQLARRRPGR